MERPLFSIVIPVYNAERYLPECLDSLLRQEEKDFELILINDGSTDDSEIVCKDYQQKDSRIQVVSKENGGQVSALIVGIKRSKGEYCLLLDADDWVDPDFLTQIRNFTIQIPDVIIENFIAEPSGNVIQTNYEKDKVMTGKELVESNPVVHTANDACFSWRMVFRLDFLKEKGLLPNPKIVIGEDAELNLRALAAAERAIAISYAGYHYRTDTSGSLMHQKYKKTLESDLANQYPARRDSFQGIHSYEQNMAVYYVGKLIYEVIENARRSPEGLTYQSLHRILNAQWLRDSYRILGQDLKKWIVNRNEYCLQLAMKYRMTLLLYIYYKR